MDNPVFVTRSKMPEFSEYVQYMSQLFSTRFLTNNGPFCQCLEKNLAKWLNIEHLAVCSNGTLALQLALHIAGLSGKKVITTPFSYVATVSAPLWVGCEVVFADIDEETLCLSPASVAEHMSTDVAGIVPVHVYGAICDVDAMAKVAENIPIIYDAAQCFGSAFRGKSVLDYGDYSTCSFHATKVFHTVEGGCIVAHSEKALESLKLMRACGHSGDTHIHLGVNAKLSEVHAAMGLCLLEKTKSSIAARRQLSQMYDALLPSHLVGRPKLQDGLEYNYAYYPVIFDDEKTLLKVQERLNAQNIFPRRYFYPVLTSLPYLKTRQSCPVAESVSRRVLSLPLYEGLEESIVDSISQDIRFCCSRTVA